MAGCHKNSMSIILRYLNAVSQSNVKIDSCKISHFTGSKFNLKLLSIKANACIVKSSNI